MINLATAFKNTAYQIYMFFGKIPILT